MRAQPWPGCPRCADEQGPLGKGACWYHRQIAAGLIERIPPKKQPMKRRHPLTERELVLAGYLDEEAK